MTSQEVNEYMHRFLDDDLSEDEVASLMEHLMASPASAAMFERLKRLNSDLEQLPKVTPPVSIVDSILPRLEREGLWNETATPAAIPAAAPAPMLESVTPTRSVPRGGRSRNVYKWTGGIAAAAIALTVFISTMMPGTTGSDNAADNALHEMEESSAAMDSAANDAGAGTTVEPTAKVMNDAPASDADRADTGNIAGEQAVGAEAPGFEGTAETDQLVTGMNVQDQSGDLMTPKAVEEAEGSAADPAPKLIEGDKTKSGDSAAASKEDEAVADQAVPVLPADGDKTKGGESHEPIYSLGIPEPEPIVSPDQASMAVIAPAVGTGQQVIISDVTGHVVYASSVYQGDLLNLQWSSDSTKVTFHVATESETRQVTIDLVNRTEAAAK